MNTTANVVNIPVYKNLSLKNLPNEIWKDIPSYEGFYQASNYGRIKSLDRTVPYMGKYLKKEKGIIRALSQDPNGYWLVSLTKNKITKIFRAHRLVLYAFVGESDLFTDHINENKWDNRLENLCYVTPRENSQRKIINSSKKTPLGVSAVRGKYRASIYYNRQKHDLGTFDDENEASNKYQLALSDLENIEKYVVESSKHKPHLPKNITFRKDTKKYQIRISINGKYKCMGSFFTPEEAVKKLKTIKQGLNGN